MDLYSPQQMYRLYVVKMKQHVINVRFERLHNKNYPKNSQINLMQILPNGVETLVYNLKI